MDIRTIDYTTRDYEGFRTDMIDLLKTKIPEYSDFSSSDFGVVLIELLAHGLDIISYYNDRVANELFPETAIERESIIRHCRRLGYELKNAEPSQFYQVFKIIPQPLDYVIPRGAKLSVLGEDSVEFELLDDLKIPKGCNGLEKDSNDNYMYKVLIEHGSTVHSDILGSSNGAPYQEFTISEPFVLVDSLKLYIHSSTGVEEWERVANFLDSDISSKQYMVEVSESDEVKVMFGSGTSGMIPPIYANGITASYRTGGGTQGNVPLESITQMTSKLAVIIDTMNVEQVQVGKDKESIEEARIHAPLSLKTLWRAVTPSDYENLLMQEFPNEVLKVKVIPEDDKFTISIYTLTSDPNEDLPELLKEQYLEFLDSRKEIGYSLQMYPPTYSDVTLNVNIKTTKAYKNSEVQELVKGIILDTYAKGSLGFGEELLVSQLTKTIMLLPGVLDINVTPVGNITPSNTTIVRVTDVNVNVIGGI